MTEGFTTDSLWAGTSHQRVMIPAKLTEILAKSYQDGTDYVTSGALADASVRQLIRYGELFARRAQLSFRYRLVTIDGKPALRFAVRDRRPYRKTSAYWEQA